MGNPDFYTKVARKFGGYRSGAQRITEYPGQNPDQVFDQKLFAVAGNDSCVLDVGCADGRNILRIAHHFKQVYAIDLSDGMLEVARANQTAAGITNIIFEKQNAARTTFQNEFFDAVGSRRGPAFYSEYFRVLKPGGYFIHTFIGEQDAMELKKIFGRGQNFGQWNTPFRQKEQQSVEGVGFDLVYVEDFYFSQYYSTVDDFNLFLQSVPIFEDFDPKRDQTYVETYVRNFQTAKGIGLPRHILVSVAKKT